jgi:hypothetical protein
MFYEAFAKVLGMFLVGTHENVHGVFWESSQICCLCRFREESANMHASVAKHSQARTKILSHNTHARSLIFTNLQG